MKAVVYHRPGHVEVNDVDDPKIEDPQDVILRVTSTAICGSNLHIYNRFFPQLKDMSMCHEFMGTVEETERNVSNLRKGVVLPDFEKQKDTHGACLSRLTFKGGEAMLGWAVTFLIIALVAAVFGFGGIAAASAGIAKLLFFLFLVICVVFFLLGWRGEESLN